MKALLLVAHGSRQDESNEQVRELVGVVRRAAGTEYGYVAHAFLQFAAPSFDEALQKCVESGAERIVVLPYLLSPGSHVRKDIPDLMANGRQRFPFVEIEVTPYVGASPMMAELLIRLGDRH